MIPQKLHAKGVIYCAHTNHNCPHVGHTCTYPVHISHTTLGSVGCVYRVVVVFGRTCRFCRKQMTGDFYPSLQKLAPSFWRVMGAKQQVEKEQSK